MLACTRRKYYRVSPTTSGGFRPKRLGTANTNCKRCGEAADGLADEVQWAVLETSGAISFIKKPS
jgi:hypothetical protein